MIGIEFASFFNSLGVQVTVIEMLDEILGGMDKELSAMLRAEYAKRGIKFMLSTKVISIAEVSSDDGKPQVQVSYENAEGAGAVLADRLLMSVWPSSGDKRIRVRKPGFTKDWNGEISV